MGLANSHAHVVLIHVLRLLPVEETVGHDGQVLLACHPSCKGKVEGDSAIGHVNSVDTDALVFREVLVVLEVLGRDQVLALGDIDDEEVTSFANCCLHWVGLRVLKSFGEEVSILSEVIADSLDVGLAFVALTSVRFPALVETSGDGDLAGSVSSIVNCVANDTTHLDNRSGSNSPADLPAGSTKELTS